MCGGCDVRCKRCGMTRLSEWPHICCFADRLRVSLVERYPAFAHNGKGKVGLSLSSAEWRNILAAMDLASLPTFTQDDVDACVEMGHRCDIDAGCVSLEIGAEGKDTPENRARYAELCEQMRHWESLAERIALLVPRS